MDLNKIIIKWITNQICVLVFKTEIDNMLWVIIIIMQYASNISRNLQLNIGCSVYKDYGTVVSHKCNVAIKYTNSILIYMLPM